MSVLTTNQSNIEMRDVQDLEQGDIFVRHEFYYGSLTVQAWRVVDIETDSKDFSGHRTSTVVIEPLNCGLQSDGNAHFTADERKHETRYVAAWDTVAVVVGS